MQNTLIKVWIYIPYICITFFNKSSQYTCMCMHTLREGRTRQIERMHTTRIKDGNSTHLKTTYMSSSVCNRASQNPWKLDSNQSKTRPYPMQIHNSAAEPLQTGYNANKLIITFRFARIET